MQWVKIAPPPRFPRRIILAGESFPVNVEEVMVLYQQLEIEDTAELNIEGEVAIVE
jgi:hypothetical protein